MKTNESPWTVEDVPVCNCADCGREMVGVIPHSRKAEFRKLVNSTKNYPVIPRLRIAGRLNGRPYCRACILRNDRPATLEGAGYNGERVNNKPLPE